MTAAYAEQVHTADGRHIGWVQRNPAGGWWARSVETGSTTTEHATRSTAVALLVAEDAGRQQAKTAPPISDDQKRRLRGALLAEPKRPAGGAR